MNPHTQPGRYKKVLIVDNDEMDIFISDRIIKSSLFASEVVLKNCVTSALNYLEKIIFESGVLPEIIFLDLDMPGKNGFDFLDELTILSAHSEIDFRVVILSNELERFNRKTKSAEIYPMVQAVLQKPLDPDALVNI
jgi:CheY-like chemotaxis protein